ncbi:MAG: hypothetical protein DRP93_01030 [Candidatus Neomarinimicrobiota bacterium]|nr:MAG: hypothetical protein DRP93_01030 [Candidatus Neomarinimicrobiota bacterium]
MQCLSSSILSLFNSEKEEARSRKLEYPVFEQTNIRTIPSPLKLRRVGEVNIEIRMHDLSGIILHEGG